MDICSSEHSTAINLCVRPAPTRQHRRSPARQVRAVKRPPAWHRPGLNRRSSPRRAEETTRTSNRRKERSPARRTPQPSRRKSQRDTSGAASDGNHIGPRPTLRRYSTGEAAAAEGCDRTRRQRVKVSLTDNEKSVLMLLSLSPPRLALRHMPSLPLRPAPARRRNSSRTTPNQLSPVKS